MSFILTTQLDVEPIFEIPIGKIHINVNNATGRAVSSRLRVTTAGVALVFLVAALVTMPPIAAPSLHQPVPATAHGLGRHVSIAARDAEAQVTALGKRRL